MNKQDLYNTDFINKNFNLVHEIDKVLIYKHSTKDIILTKYKEDIEIGLKDTIETIDFLKESYQNSRKFYGITYTTAGSSITDKARDYWANCDFIQKQY